MDFRKKTKNFPTARTVLGGIRGWETVAADERCGWGAPGSRQEGVRKRVAEVFGMVERKAVGHGGTRRVRLSGLPAKQIAKEEVKFGCGRAGQCASA
jgi:hypothetical protein